MQAKESNRRLYTYYLKLVKSTDKIEFGYRINYFEYLATY